MLIAPNSAINTLVTSPVTGSARRGVEPPVLSWADPDAAGPVMTRLKLSDSTESTFVDMSEWPADLDAEARAIHSDLAAASFRTLSED